MFFLFFHRDTGPRRDSHGVSLAFYMAGVIIGFASTVFAARLRMRDGELPEARREMARYFREREVKKEKRHAERHR